MDDSGNTLPHDAIEAHPPERGEHKKQYVILYSCCCCCCCCLHTIGGVVGAAVAGATGNYRAEEFFAGKKSAPSGKPSARLLPTSQGLYWLSTAIILVLGLGVGLFLVLSNSESDRLASDMTEMLFGYGIVLILLGPAFLLVASIFMAVILGFRSDLRRHAGYWKSLGVITGSMIAGTVVGIIAMVIIGVVLSAAF